MYGREFHEWQEKEREMRDSDLRFALALERKAEGRLDDAATCIRRARSLMDTAHAIRIEAVKPVYLQAHGG